MLCLSGAVRTEPTLTTSELRDQIVKVDTHAVLMAGGEGLGNVRVRYCTADTPISPTVPRPTTTFTYVVLYRQNNRQFQFARSTSTRALRACFIGNLLFNRLLPLFFHQDDSGLSKTKSNESTSCAVYVRRGVYALQTHACYSTLYSL